MEELRFAVCQPNNEGGQLDRSMERSKLSVPTIDGFHIGRVRRAHDGRAKMRNVRDGSTKNAGRLTSIPLLLSASIALIINSLEAVVEDIGGLG